jgi:DegV family protein with EDD domain
MKSMKRIAIITDDNAGFRKEELSQYEDLFVIGMPTIINGETYYENVNITQEQFYEFLEMNADVKTSQPTPGSVLELWDKLLKEYEYVLHVPMSSGLSKSCDTAKMLANDYNGRVIVIDNHRISVTLKRSILDAINLSKRGVEPLEIKNILEETKSDSTIFIMVDTLKYLKKGGRISASAAALGSALHIKPILNIDGGLLEPLDKVIGTKKGRAYMINLLKKKIRDMYNNDLTDVEFCIAYTFDLEKALDFKYQIEQELGIKITTVDPLSLSVSTHIGPGSLAVTSAKIIK